MQGFGLPDTSWRCRGVAINNMGLWKHLEHFFSPLFLLAPAAAASEPAPGQPEEFLRARKRRHAATLAEPFPGQLLVLVVVMYCKSSVRATPRFFYIRQASERDLFHCLRSIDVSRSSKSC
jgi:hypothetical protein